MIKTVLSLLNEESIEDRILHPADNYIEEELKSGSDVRELYSWCSENLESGAPHLAEVLHCISRLEKKITGKDGKQLMLSALKNSNLDVREAAICAFESWGGHDSISALKQYVESEPIDWLRNYANKVIEDPRYT